MDSSRNDKSGEIFGAIFASAPDAVVVIDTESKIVLTSPAVDALFQYSSSDLIGEMIEVLIPLKNRIPHLSPKYDACTNAVDRQYVGTAGDEPLSSLGCGQALSSTIHSRKYCANVEGCCLFQVDICDRTFLRL
jgi:nitrogen-specific signal transduction histidine kinase